MPVIAANFLEEYNATVVLRECIQLLNSPSAGAAKWIMALAFASWLLWRRRPGYALLVFMNVLIVLQTLDDLLILWIEIKMGRFDNPVTLLSSFVFVTASYSAIGAMRDGECPLYIPVQTLAFVGWLLLSVGWVLFYTAG